MFQRLLICTDLTDGLYRFVRFVPSLAAAGLRQITFLHVVPISNRDIPKVDQEKVEQARDRLSLAQFDTPEGVEVKVEVQSGRVAERILAAAKEDQSDLILLGAESRSLLTEKLFGSTATELSQKSKVPILILRPQLVSAFTNEELDLRCRHFFRYFLIPYNDGEAAKYLLSRVKHYAEHRAAGSRQECLLLWVIEDDDRIEKLMYAARVQAAETKLAAIKAELEQLNFTVTTSVASGAPIPETLKAALESDTTAITIASSTLGKWAEWSKTSFAGELLRRSWHPILFFPLIE